MQPHAADQGKAAMADLMSIAKWKAPHASIDTWQAGLDEIDRFYRSATRQSNTSSQSPADFVGISHEYNAEQAGINGAQSMFGPAHEELLSFSPDEMSYPVDYALTTKQNGKSLPQQEQAAQFPRHTNSPVPNPAIKLHPPYAPSSLNPENATSPLNLNQTSQSTNIGTPPEPFPKHYQPPSETSASNLLQPPTHPVKKLSLAHSQSSLPLSRETSRESNMPLLLPKNNASLPLQQQNPQWSSVEKITARPKWTLEPPPPPGLQPAFEAKGEGRGLEAGGEGSRIAVPLREKSGKGGSRLGGGAMSGDGLREGYGQLGGESSAGAEGRRVEGVGVETRLGGLRVNVTERDEVADVTACRKGKVSDGRRVESEDGTRDSGPDENASSSTIHTSAPDAIAASEEHEREGRNQQTDVSQHDNNTTTSLNPQDQAVQTTDPHINFKASTANPPRWSPTNNRTFSNARDEIASLKRGRKDTSSSSSSYNSSPPNSASSSQPPLKKKKEKEPRENQNSSVSRLVEETSEQGTPKESNPEKRNNDYVHAPVPADQGSQVSTAASDPQALDLPPEKSSSDSFPSASSPSSKRKDKEEKEEDKEKGKERTKASEKEPTKKRKRPPRPTMSKRELSNLEGTTVEGKLRRRGGAQEGQKQSLSQPQQRSQQQREQQKQQKQDQDQKQEQKERKGQEEGKGQGKGKERKGKEIP
ncbi:hypothetical protein KC319_g12883, partial [Hortaea werneckii]